MANANATEFWSQRGIKTPIGATLAEPAIIALENARPVFISAFDKAPLPKETSGMILRSMENFSDRLYEQAVGMLVCLGTGSAAAAETIARTVIEGSFNLLFIVSQDHEARLFAFFNQYLQEHDRKLREWQQLESAKPQSAGRDVVLNAIADRASVHKHLGKFVTDLATGLGFKHLTALSQHWPSSLYKRCEQIQKHGAYLTSYHRLSASSHISAEETIRWLIGYYLAATGPDPDIQKKLSAETVSYSAMMCRIAIMHYIEANVMTCRALDASFDAVSLQKTISQLSKSIDDIASSAGAPV